MAGQPRHIRLFFITLCLAWGYHFLGSQPAHAETSAALDSLGASYDSLYSSDLNGEEGADSTEKDEEATSNKSAQQIFEENPHYTMRSYDHRQQVIVGSVVMFCVALAMVAMNNYNPKR